MSNFHEESKSRMTGAESLVDTLVRGGVEVCFANPGTSEMHFMAAAGKHPGLRVILGLFEGVCTGAADGYARMAGKPAATLLHLGPGLGNGLANLHNARRASSPVINIVGDHATYHLKHDAPLTSDIASMAGTVSDWVRTSRDPRSVPRDGAEAILAANSPPGRVATLILPADCSWGESGNPEPIPDIALPRRVEQETIESVAAVLRKGEPTVILMGSPFLIEEGLWHAGRTCRASGARLLGNRANRIAQRGAGRVSFERLPYPVQPALAMLKGTAHLVLVGAKPPVSFFAWRNLPGWLTPEGCRIHTLATPEQDGIAALEELAEALHAPAEPDKIARLHRPPLPEGDLTPEKVWTALAALMPDHSIIIDEGVSSSRDADQWMGGAPPHDWLNNTGGSIGFGMPVATGAAVASPDRKVFSMQADGSSMYTLQSLWSQAHESLDVVTVLFANHSYKILKGEMERVGLEGVSAKSLAVFDLSPPKLNWGQLAAGMGVHAVRAESAEDFCRHLKFAASNPGPHLIEVTVP